MPKINRRTFLKTTAAAAGTFTLPRFSIGQSGPSANSKLNIAVIGAGNIAGMCYGQLKNENIVALADVDSNMFLQKAEKYPQLTKARQFSDFRVMLDKMGSEIDAVCINTPDHTHFAATMDAMQRGKHVCTQKPLTHNIWQARTLRKAKAKYGVVTNMANQGHTYDGIRTMREWYEADVFGQVRKITLGFPGPHYGQYFEKPETMPPAAQPVPDNLDWDLWLGPAPDTDYNRIYHPLMWRGFSQFGTGMFGDWFCHIGDGPVWILDLYEPTAVECIEREVIFDGFVTNSSVIRFEFPARGDKAPLEMIWYDGADNGGKPVPAPEEWDLGKVPTKGSFWYGDKQNGFLDQRSNNPRLVTREAFKEFKENVTIPEKYPRVAEGGPFAEWARAIKGEGPEPGSNFDYAAPMTEVCLLGSLAQFHGGRIEWDAKAGRVTNRPELNQYVREEARPGWEYGNDLW